VDPTHAVFFYTDANGKLVKGIESDLDEWVAEEDAPKEDAPKQNFPKENSPKENSPKNDNSKFDLPPSIPESQPAPPRKPEPAPPATPEVRPVVADPGRKPVTAPSLGYSTTAPAQRRRFRLIAVIALLVAGILAFLTQNFWLPRPPLKLAVSEAGGVLTIRWNAPALRGIDSASLFVNDGGMLRTLPLDRFVLERGFLAYEPISVRVTATLSARNSKAMIAWFAPAPKPAPDSMPPPQSPAP
jgi:hypothetical protein